MSPPPATLRSLSARVSSATARATVVVPVSNGGNSKAPRGPFHTSVRKRKSLWIRSSAVAGPISRIMASAGTLSMATVWLGALALNSRAITASVGRTISGPPDLASAMMARALGAISRSHSEAPTSTPAAKRKVLAMAPPITNVSTLAARLPRRSSLVDTLAPPITAATGRSGAVSALFRASSSASISRPAKAGSSRAIAAIEAWARCAAAKASLT